MEEIFMTLRCGQTYVRIYKRPTTYYASLFGQLYIPFDSDEIEMSNPVDLMFELSLRFFNPNIPVEVLDKTTKEWSLL